MPTRLAALLLALALPASATAGCVDCHRGGALKSWSLSKHGVIARIEAGRPRQRTPDCAGCHIREAATPTHPLPPHERAAARQETEAACRNCHAPRYVAEQWAALDRGIAIAALKAREADALLAAAQRETRGRTQTDITAIHAQMGPQQRALRLGLAHQAPDDAWWLGQAALDGTLLRLKTALGEARRSRATATTR